MAKQRWKPGNMLYPVPAVLVTSRNREGDDDVCTVAWAGTVCTNPPMVSISLRKSRLTYDYIMETGVYVINLTTEALARATDFCGVRSGRDVDKFSEMQLEREEAAEISCSMLAASPVSIECRVTETKDLGSHTMFLAEVAAVHADEGCLDEDNRFDLLRSKPIVYAHGAYCGLGKSFGSFGWSVKKERRKSGKNGSKLKSIRT